MGHESWSVKVESRASSLSMSGQWRAVAKERASVDLPVPGWPFIAMISGPIVFASSKIVDVVIVFLGDEKL